VLGSSAGSSKPDATREVIQNVAEGVKGHIPGKARQCTAFALPLLSGPGHRHVPPQSSPMRTRTSPFVGSSTPAMILETLVFPAPLNPMRPKTSPSWISNETLLTALDHSRSSVTYFFSSSATFTIVSPEAISCFFISPTVLKKLINDFFGAPSLGDYPLSSSIALSAIDSMSSGRCEVTSTAISFVLARVGLFCG